MKQLSIITISSYVDLITNSSSELFVCDTKKSLNAVKSIIEKILNNYWDELDLPKQNIWTDVFKEPEIAEQDFDLNSYPDQEDVEKVRNYDYFKPQERENQEKLKEKYPMPEKFKQMSWEDRAKNEEYQKWNSIYDKYRMELSELIWAERDTARARLVKYFGDKVETYISYDIKVKKDNILLWSAGDNSVPYECWNRINAVLGAQNYHLG